MRNTETIKNEYVKPEVVLFQMQYVFSVLDNMSVEGELELLEDGGEI